MASVLGDLSNAITGMFSGSKDGSVLGIDIGASSVKVVQLRQQKGVAILETYGEIALGPYAKLPIGRTVKLEAEKIADALKDLMKEANVTARLGGMSIPFSSSLITILEMPKADKEQLKRMVPIEARKYIPVPVSEVMIDWFMIPPDDENDAFDRVGDKKPERNVQEVLMAAIHNETLHNYQEIASQIGLHVDFFEIEIFSAIRSVLGRGVAPVMVVEMGASTTKIYIVERGLVRLSHLVTTGGMHMTEMLANSLNWDFEKAERIKREIGLSDNRMYGESEMGVLREALLSTLTRVFSEANRVLLSYGKRYNKNVSHVVFSGGGSSLPGLKEEAKKALAIEVEIADPFSRTEAPAFLLDVLSRIGPSFAVAVGLALRNLRIQS